MATLEDVRALVEIAIARDDAIAISVIDAAVNYAVIVTSLTFDPPEMSRESDIILTGGANSIYFPNVVESTDIESGTFVGLFEIDDDGDLMPIDGQTLSTNLLDLIKVYNKTRAIKVNFVPYERWDMVVPSDLTVVKYWTLFGNIMHLKATAADNITLTISYTTYPDTLVNDEDEIPFDHYDSYIIALSTEIAFAAFEESDSADMWSKISNIVGSPLTLSTKAKSIIEGQRVIMERAISAVNE